ncbi:MAG TPA: PilZ domain-containing protein [Anaeromyxobacteraceae bacterium]|nr:PilZ domain-containing protein [Anaeromyxobacteraceae bacterium]
MRRVSTRTNRAGFRRVMAPIYHRPITWFALGMLRRSADGSLGGFRAYSDEKQKEGRLLEVEVFLPEGASVTVVAQVAWVEPLPEGSVARFDVGLEYVKASPGDLERIGTVLEA